MKPKDPKIGDSVFIRPVLPTDDFVPFKGVVKAFRPLIIQVEDEQGNLHDLLIDNLEPINNKND